MRQVVNELVMALEDTYNLAFTHKSLHDATPTGQLEDFHQSLSAVTGGDIPCHVHAMTPLTGLQVHRMTLEPLKCQEVRWIQCWVYNTQANS